MITLFPKRPFELIVEFLHVGPTKSLTALAGDLRVVQHIYIYIWMFPKIGGKPPKWMVYKGKPYLN